jgi:hypothetical protein
MSNAFAFEFEFRFVKVLLESLDEFLVEDLLPVGVLDFGVLEDGLAHFVDHFWAFETLVPSIFNAADRIGLTSAVIFAFASNASKAINVMQKD